MLDRHSALASVKPYASSSLTIAERPGFVLTQVAGLGPDFESKLTAILGPLPASVNVSQANGNHTIFRIGPSQFWIVGPETDATPSMLQGHCAVTPLSHARVRIALSGASSRAVLAMLMPIDFHPQVFTPGAVALTGLHHTPVTVHCTGEHAFDIYVLRTFARDVWDAITDAALGFADSR
ncbi:sarcosine oxidase subunit gamma [Aestuariivirga sp.]|uniref:sarcosine oxidase subunit gamma n=1 Tax=Aestuariivirga sp. TaxID=2650926 RepID=UPI003BAA43D7